MAFAAHHALLQAPGVRPDLEHVEIVIGFKHGEMRPANVMADVFGDVAEVHGERDADALQFPP